MTDHLKSKCLQPLSAFHKAGVLASRLRLPPSQHMPSTTQETPDVKMAVTSCNVEADVLGNERWGQEQLQSGL